jgi:hypothetical protein
LLEIVLGKVFEQPLLLGFSQDEFLEGKDFDV